MPDTPEKGPAQGRPLNGSAFARTARLASLPVGFAGRTTLGLGKRIVGTPANLVLDEVQRRTADQIFSVLGQLKGGAMKFGQAMSIFEAALPEEFIAPYLETLVKLQDSAPPMPPGTVHRVMAQEFGVDWRESFPSFEDKPAASASIGLITVGADNGYGHPTPAALAMLAAAGTTGFRTDRCGLIVVGGTGANPVVWTERRC